MSHPKIGENIIYKATCANSMDWAKEELERVPHGTLFLCDHHESPRGRQGRSWSAAGGQLMLTFIIKFCTNPALPSLNMALTLGFLEPLKKHGIHLKWPNDFVHNHHKVAGMLIEVVWLGDTLQGVIVGFGLNVNNVFKQTDPLYGKATSLTEITGQTFDLEDLQKEICAGLNHYYDQWSAYAQLAPARQPSPNYEDLTSPSRDLSANTNELELIYSEWRSAQVYLGQNITVHTKENQRISGVMEDVLPNGDMVLVSDGNRLVLNLHDVFEVL